MESTEYIASNRESLQKDFGFWVQLTAEFIKDSTWFTNVAYPLRYGFTVKRSIAIFAPAEAN